MCPKMNGILKLAINQLRREITKQEALVKLSCRAVGGAVVPRADDGVTGEEAVSLWSQHFLQHGVSEPLLSSHYIIAHVLGNKTLECVERRRLKETLTDKERESVWRLCSRRLTRMPVQYVIEEWDFRDLTLKMRPPVFIPRPETEELVGLVLEHLQSEQMKAGGEAAVLEVGCGSGAITLSLLHAAPQLKAIALDRSHEAVCLTEENANRLGLQDRLEVCKLDIMSDAGLMVRDYSPVDVLVSNPPYLFTEDMTSLEAEILRFEDHSALDGGLDGMSIIRQILAVAPQLLTTDGRVFLEVDPRHPPLIKSLVEEQIEGLQYVGTSYDLTTRPRFCVLKKNTR
ncbi:MTRF1L release factor glutamine methyltransferase-like [Brachyhypopomus gauderio]|uniref:MTRF1L release factor glutamine methyltransferase-like n=1 Tax=Brachyhypopomus gauderio TaxID=698409 RepID=UPI004042776B